MIKASKQKSAKPLSKNKRQSSKFVFLRSKCSNEKIVCIRNKKQLENFICKYIKSRNWACYHNSYLKNELNVIAIKNFKKLALFKIIISNRGFKYRHLKISSISNDLFTVYGRKLLVNKLTLIAESNKMCLMILKQEYKLSDYNIEMLIENWINENTKHNIDIIFIDDLPF